MQSKYFGTDGVRGKVGEAPITPEFVMKLGYAAGVTLVARENLPAPRATPGRADRQGHAHLRLHARGRARGRASPPRASTSAVRADADARRRLPHARAAPAGRRRDLAPRTTLRRQRHQVLFRRRHQAARRGRGEIEARLDSRWVRRVRPNSARRAASTTPPGATSSSARAPSPTSSTCAAEASSSTARTAPAYHIAPQGLPRARRRGDPPSAPSPTASTSTTASARRTRASLRGGARAQGRPRHRARRRRRPADDGRQRRADLRRRPAALRDRPPSAMPTSRPAGVVGTLMSNLGFEHALGALGVPFARAKVGDRYVLENCCRSAAGCWAARTPATSSASTSTPPATASSRRCRCWRRYAGERQAAD
jgi:phosphoglucosamine mutase